MARRSAQQDLKRAVRRNCSLGRNLLGHAAVYNMACARMAMSRVSTFLTPIDFLSMNCTIACMTFHDLHEGSEV
jgi:hypothetical protein